ncbi:MAG TPA: Smr/MutS family protein [Kofleriaceae bacterium]|nr:Smr/MutS family protein [Kofleriaceae bacterium]
MAKCPGSGPDEIDADLLDPDAALPEECSATGVAAPLTDELDLHAFRPRDCADLVDEYLHAAQDAGLPRVRIVHGKGTGALRRIVHGVLDRHPAVRGYRLAGEGSGGWGATVVVLHPAGPAA